VRPVKAPIIAIHSFRGGTGKSNIAANLAALLAMDGRRVGIVDTDVQSPGVHVLFGLDETQVDRSLNQYLWGKSGIDEVAHDVTNVVGESVTGKVFLVPSSIRAEEIARVLRESYNVGRLNNGFQDLIKALSLDILLVDTHPGLGQETLLTIAVSDVLLLMLRPDQQDYQGTGVTVRVARQLDTPRMLMVVNKVPAAFDAEEVRMQVEQTYACEIAAVLPHVEEMMTLASAGLFVLRYPDHPVTDALRRVAASLIG
jgi:septum site-determining protein MinD